MLLALPLLFTLAAAPRDAELAFPSPPPCNLSPTFSGEIPEEGNYLFPGRVDRLIPANTSVWIQERAGFHHEYALMNETRNNTTIPVEVIRTGLLDGALVQIKPTAALPLNNKINLIKNGQLFASFNPNVAADTLAPTTPNAQFQSGLNSLDSPCFVPGFSVSVFGALSEPALLVVEDMGEEIAVSTLTQFYVAAPEGSALSLSLVLVDFAGNRSQPTVMQTVKAEQRTTGGGGGGGRVRESNGVFGCTCAGRPSSATSLASLFLGAAGIALALARRR